MKVLVIGSGGREHAIAYALHKSPKVNEIHAIPGNPGIAAIGTCHPGSVEDIEGILKFVEENKIDLTVVGPEVPLCMGLVDVLEDAGHKVFGPRKYAANFEGEVLKQKTIAAGVNYPGTSEYQSGFSFNPRQYKRGDAEFNAPKFFETPHSDWMVENSWKYGFVFRFPVNEYPNETVGDKSFKTGESKKLMIYRYVGEGHAAAMKQLDMCMEEYVEYLMAHPHIAVYENGKLKYEITRVSYNNQPTATVEVSRNAAEYTVSMDNCGGVIVCMMYE